MVGVEGDVLSVVSELYGHLIGDTGCTDTVASAGWCNGTNEELKKYGLQMVERPSSKRRYTGVAGKVVAEKTWETPAGLFGQHTPSSLTSCLAATRRGC